MQAVRWTMLASPGPDCGQRRSTAAADCLSPTQRQRCPEHGNRPCPVLARQVCRSGLRSDR